MNHEGEGEIPDRRRVTFRNDSEDRVHCSIDSDVKPVGRCTPDGKDRNRHKEQFSPCTDGSDKRLSDVDSRKSSSKTVGILRPRSISPSPLVCEALLSTQSRFKFAQLSKAMRRSNETRGHIEKMKKQIFQRLEYQQREPNTIGARSVHSKSVDYEENGRKQPPSLSSQERRMVCLQSTKAMMNQSLPPSMMPFVEETLKAAHFLQRRRKENGHGRIVHKILIEQHTRILKEIELNKDRNRETSHTSRQQSHKSELS